jgi:hypothetical protein
VVHRQKPRPQYSSVESMEGMRKWEGGKRIENGMTNGDEWYDVIYGLEHDRCESLNIDISADRFYGQIMQK